MFQPASCGRIAAASVKAITPVVLLCYFAPLLSEAAASGVPRELIDLGGFGCSKVWKTATAKNQITQCFSADHLLNEYLGKSALRIAPLAFAVLAILVSVIAFLFYPFFMIGRYVCKCCGSNRRRPGTLCCGGSEWDDKPDFQKEAAYTRTEVRCVKVASFVILLLSVSALIVTLVGTSSLQVAYDGVFENSLGIISWGNQKLTDIRSNMTIDGQLIEPLTPQLFDDMQVKVADFQTIILDFERTSSQYVDYGNIAALAIAIGPMVFIVITVLCAVFDIRRIIPLVNSIFHFLLLLPFGVLGGIFVIMGIVLADVSAERQMFLEGKPGLFSLWLVPVYEEEVPFGRIRDDVQSAERTNSIEGCRNMLNICADRAVYSAATPDIVYNCPGLTDPNTKCTALENLQAFFNGVSLMSGSPTSCSNLTDQAGCSLPICAEVCTRETVKNNSASATKNLRKATRAKGSFDTSVKPLLNFTVIIGELLVRLSVFPDLRDGMLVAGIGLSLFCFFFVADLFIIFRGQKRFFKLPREPEEGGEEGGQGADGIGGAAASNEPTRV